MNKWYRLGKKYSSKFDGIRELNEFLKVNGMDFEPYSFEDFSEDNYEFLCKYIDVFQEKEEHEYDKAGRRYMFEWGFLSNNLKERIAKVSFNKSGGTARGTAITNRVTIPTSWIKEMGITEEDRVVRIVKDGNKITIEKLNSNVETCDK